MSSPGKTNKKRRYSTSCGRKRKRRTLPDLQNDSNPEVDDVSSKDTASNDVDSVVFDTSANVSDASGELEEDLDLSQNYLIKKESSRKLPLRAKGLIWVKHNKKDCFWPCYIKSVSRTKISVFFIGWSTLEKDKKGYNYSIKSKRLKEFNAENKTLLVEQGRKIISDPCWKHQCGLGAFNKAVELSVAYLLEMEKFPSYFQNEQDIFDYFNTNGDSFYQKKYFEECEKKVLVSDTDPFTTIASKSDITSISNGCPNHGIATPILTFNNSDKTAPTDATIHCDKMRCNELNPNDGEFDTNLNSDNSIVLTPPSSSTSEKPKRRRSSLSMARKLLLKDNFIEQSIELVDCILSGNCDDYIKGIINGTEFSERLVEFYEKWDWSSCGLNPKPKKLKHEGIYFEDDNQSQEVLNYLNNLVERYHQTWNHVRKQDFLFHVLLPEATICSISKIKRRSMQKANKLFKEGFPFNNDLHSGQSFEKPLTEDERNLIERRNERLAKELFNS